MATRRRQTSAVLRLPQRFTVENVAAVLDDVRARVKKGGKLTIDLADVHTVDSAGLQLLTAVRRQLDAEGREFELKSVPETLVDSARLLGVDMLLELA